MDRFDVSCDWLAKEAMAPEASPFNFRLPPSVGESTARFATLTS